MRSPTLRQQAQYRIDNFMARGGASIFVSLFVAFVGLILIVTATRMVLIRLLPVNADGNEHSSFFQTLLEMTDQGRLAEFESVSRWYQVGAVLTMLLGLLVFAALISAMTNTLDRRIARLRKGHSKVLEQGHTLLLGWDEQRVLEILRELIIAKESEGRSVIVLLADRDKEEMDDVLSIHLRERRNTRIVTRSGNPADPDHLDVVALDSARSVIVLSGVSSVAPEDEREAADAQAIKILLALTARPQQPGTIVAEIANPAIRSAVHEISEQITTLCATEIIAKILMETSRSVGLSAVYNSIFGFEDSELYFYRADDWADRTFSEICFHFEDGVVVGIRSKHESSATGDTDSEATVTSSPPAGARFKWMVDSKPLVVARARWRAKAKPVVSAPSNKRVELNPAATRKLRPDDEVLILAQDDSTIKFLAEPVECRDLPTVKRQIVAKREKALLVGWTAKTPRLVEEFGAYVPAESCIDIIVDGPTPEVKASVRDLDTKLGVGVRLLDLDPTEPTCWSHIDLGQYDHILLLARDHHAGEGDRADAETILVLLLLRSLLRDRESRQETVPNVISELVRSENRALVRHVGVHDSVVSPHFISMLLAQLSEERDLLPVYEELFDPRGSEIYLKPARLYFETLPTDASFADLMALARDHGEICLGVKLSGADEGDDGSVGLHINPRKDNRFELTAECLLVVLAVDEG